MLTHTATLHLSDFSSRARFLTSASVCFLLTFLPGIDMSGASAPATPAANLKVAKDFKVELLYSVPKDQQGSWVSMTTDPKGRLYVSDQYGGLYRISPPILGGNPADTKVEPVSVSLGEAQGLLWAFDSLYVVVNRGGKYESGLYRVRDTNGDDKLDEVTLLRKIDGGSEHGPHGVVLHPDGKSLVVICGNHTKPTSFARSQVPLHWNEDHLIPRMWDAGGHAVGILAPGGWIAKTDPDGKSWELISMGYRNPYDLAYNREGDLFTYDADMEWDINTPWYRPTRICHAVDGSEFGWRSGTGKWPAYYPDSLPSILNIGPGSPTGITFGYGTRFPAKYQDSLFISDWSYGKLYAIHLKPEGASYSAEKEEFITGTPLALTDLAVNPQDGALYFTVGGRRTQSALYRVTYTGSASTAASKPINLTSEAKIRRKLESYYQEKNPRAIKVAWSYLGHKDRVLRFAARTVLEHQDPNLWADRALGEKDPEAAITSLLGLVRVGDKSLQPRIVDAIDRIDWKRLTQGQQLELIRLTGLTFIRMGSPTPAIASRMIAKFDPVYPASTRELNAELSKLIVYLQSPSAAPKTMALLAKAPTQEEQMDYVYALRVLKTGWTPALREDYFKWFLKAANFKGGHSFAGFVNNIRTEAVSNLDPATKESLKTILASKPEKKSPAEVLAASGILAGRGYSHEWTLDELAPALDKELKGRNYQRGRELFGAAACAACHRFNNEGGSYGPDLSGVVGRFSSRDLLESILLPSKEVSDQYASVVITKTDGEQVTGRIVNLNEDSIMVSPNMFAPDDLVSVDRKSIQFVKNSKVSLMPEGLLTPLKKDEVLDLIAYLLARGDEKHAMFRK